MQFRTGILILGLTAMALGQTPPTTAPIRSISDPLLAQPGEHLLLCVANLAQSVTPVTTTTNPPTSVPAVLTATLQVLNGVSRAILAQSQITLPPLGSATEPPDPCLEFAVPATPTAATPGPLQQLFIAVVRVSPQPLPPSSGGGVAMPLIPVSLEDLLSSIQVFTPGPANVPTNIRTIPMHAPNIGPIVLGGVMPLAAR